MLFYLNAQELRNALAEIEKAEKNGFKFCNVVLSAKNMDKYKNIELQFDDLWVKAHPTDGHFDWGRAPVYFDRKFDSKTKKLKAIKK